MNYIFIWNSYEIRETVELVFSYGIHMNFEFIWNSYEICETVELVLSYQGCRAILHSFVIDSFAGIHGIQQLPWECTAKHSEC